MRLVPQLTCLILAFVSTASAYDSIYSRDTSADRYVARELVNDFRRRSDMMSLFSTRHLVEELEQRLLPRGTGSGNTSPGGTPQTGQPPPAADKGGGAKGGHPLPPLPVDGHQFCMEQMSLHPESFTTICEKAKAGGTLVVDTKPDPAHKGGSPLHIDTSVGGAAGAPKSGSPKKGENPPVLPPPGAKSPTDGKGQNPPVLPPPAAKPGKGQKPLGPAGGSSTNDH